eukprot:CAMPEP_0176061660 /NCGR_PEP_ID=MMETSP0120_2-20121206/30744_1 /TAXON_ID=160619 /ORGANISM="Kryptoperidinium foliaceum, Strain CCMP 1326" /LENGTH=653 /DNA_ID=CAMNT_0017395221 /DNA_START=24 /DNA_END=1981 /DNA_ORIENTATION=-
MPPQLTGGAPPLAPRPGSPVAFGMTTTELEREAIVAMCKPLERELHDDGNSIPASSDCDTSPRLEGPPTARSMERASSSMTALRSMNSMGSMETKERRRRGQTSFISSGVHQREYPASLRSKVRMLLESTYFEGFVAASIMCNFAAICVDTDGRATGSIGDLGERGMWANIVNHVCFAIFVFELFLRMYDRVEDLFYLSWMHFDLTIVFVGTLEYIVLFTGMALPGLGLVRAMRCVRIVRLLRMEALTFLKELRRLVQMLSNCVKTLFWSILLLGFAMTFWAVITVEVINPIVQELSDMGVWRDCDRCRRSFSSVMMANITLFQTVIAGDSWGKIAIPVIEARPWTSVVFVGALMTLVFGVLNLIIAVIVDTAAESREKDVALKAADLEQQEREEKRVLGKIFDRIDEDGSGGLTYEELEQGAHRLAEFRQWLRVLDVDAQDLQELFDLVDQDGSGEIDPEEFIDVLFRMKNTDTKTATRFLKGMVTRMERDSRVFKRDMETAVGDLRHAVQGLGNRDGTQSAEKVAAVEAAAQPLGFSSPASGEAAAQQDLFGNEVQQALRSAISRTMEVALEAALEAATERTSDVLAAAASSSEALMSGMQLQLKQAPQPRALSPEPSNEEDPTCCSAEAASSISPHGKNRQPPSAWGIIA